MDESYGNNNTQQQQSNKTGKQNCNSNCYNTKGIATRQLEHKHMSTSLELGLSLSDSLLKTAARLSLSNSHDQANKASARLTMIPVSGRLGWLLLVAMLLFLSFCCVLLSRNKFAPQ